jgi:hypothetical protein
MNLDPASLENLRDIVEPAPVPWWPLAPGWWCLLALLGLAAVVGVATGVRRWRADAYRRAALRELRGAETNAAIAELLKRVALAAYPRSEVAALSGTAWSRWLAETGGRPVPEAVSEALEEGVFAARGSDSARQLASFAADWIQSHRKGQAVGGVRGKSDPSPTSGAPPAPGGVPC